MKIDNSIAAVVTGAASGLGKASAEALAAAGVKVAIFDMNEEGGEAVAKAIGGIFCNVNIMSEESAVAGFAKARAAHGQERILVHCAMASRRGKTLAFDKETGRFKRTSTEDYEFGVQGILVASYRMASLSALIDSLGGIDINVKQRLPIGGQADDASDAYGWIEVGQQHMDGYHALWYARSRHLTTDYDRMRRQHEVEDAVLKQMDPATVLTHFQAIAGAGEKLLKTDVPSTMLSVYLDLAFKAKKHGIKSLELVPPFVNEIHPDFEAIRAKIKSMLAANGSN